MKRIQNLPPVLWTDLPLNTKEVYLFYYDKGQKKYTKCSDVKTAFEHVVSAGKKGYAAFAAAPIPCNMGQFGVFAFSAAGITKEYALAKNVNAAVNKAFASVFATVKAEPTKKEMPIQKIAKCDKNDKVVLICQATIDEDPKQKTYTFKADEELFEGDRRTAHLKSGEYKPVTIISKTVATPVSMLDHPLDWYVTLCTFLLKEHERKVVNKVPEEEYVEDIDELKTMRECFVESNEICDHLGVKAGYDGYSYEDPADVFADDDEEEDYNLPE